jgi:hypothetical protein
MIIPVKYSDGTMDRVQSMLLDTLILSGAITKFKRTSGWVIVGQDPIRKRGENVEPTEDDRRSDLTNLFFI